MSRKSALVAVSTLLLSAAAVAQSCNPIIDGTYCASQIVQRGNSPSTPGGVSFGAASPNCARAAWE